MNIALIGYGYWGPNVARNTHANPRAKMTVICDAREDRLEKARHLYGNETSYSTSYTEVLQRPDVDAVAIALGTSAHYDAVKLALEAGKHVYVEKPFTSTVAEAMELREIASSRALTIHVDHIMVFHPCIRYIHRLIQSGEVGDLLFIEAMRMNLGQIRRDVSAMWDLAVHDLSVIDYLTGGLEPIYLKAVGEKKFNPKETLTFLTLRFEGFIAHIRSSWISPLKERKLIVAGTRRMIVFDDMAVSEKLMIYDRGVDVISGDNVEYDDYAVKVRMGDVHVPYIEQEDALFNSIDHFVSCIESGEPSVCGPDAGIRVLKVLEAADATMNA